MKTSSLLAALVAAYLSLSSLASAQINKIGEIILAPNESARGVDFEWPYAYVSLFTDGEAKVVDLTLPNLPALCTTFNPAFGDQWNECLVVNGNFFSGHRFGGLNLWSASCAPTQLDTAGTTYHFDGLGVLNVPGREVLLYSEASASALPAGLKVYDITNSTLSYLSDNLLANNQRDGRFLLSTVDLWVYQLDGGGGSTRPLNLNIYDLAIPSSPLFAQMYNMGNSVGNYNGSTDLALGPHPDVLYAASGFDGLRVLDISVRPAPTVANTLSATGIYVQELDFVEGTIYLVVSVQLPNGQWRFRVLDCSNSFFPVPLWQWFGDQDFRIHDLKVVGHPAGLMLLLAGTNANGDATLQVWM